MRATGLFLALAIAMSVTIGLSGCGGNASPAPTTPATTPPTTPTTPPSTGGGGSGGSGAATVQWLSTLGVSGPGGTSHGQVTVDTNGFVNIQVKNGTPSATYDVDLFTYGNFQTIIVGTVTTDASGNANVTLKFPKPGNWAGGFQVSHTNLDTFSTAGTGWADTQAPLLGISTVPNVCQSAFCTGAQDPGSGSLTTSGGNVHIKLNGAVVNATYDVTQCTFGGSSCYGEGTFTTDSGGNGSFDKPVDVAPAQVWRVERVAGSPQTIQGVGFVTAFKVP